MILKIEKLTGKNFQEFAKLMNEFANLEKLTPPDEAAKKRLRRDGTGKNPKYEAYLGKIGRKHVAYTIFYMAYGSFSARPRLFLEDIFVLREFRKHGVGQKILDFVIKKAKERKCGTVDLNVIDWNTKAIKFYGKNKFKLLNWKVYKLQSKDMVPK